MGVKLAAASGGSIELVPTNTASNFTVTVPAVTAVMAIDGPAFGAYTSTDQTFSNATFTVTNYQTEEFDLGGCFNNTASTVTLNGLSAPAYSFTPNVAGYYMVTGASFFNQSITGEIIATLYKNGATNKSLSDATSVASSYNYQNQGSAMVYLNGTGDYVQIYTYQGGGSSFNHNILGASFSYFQAFLARSA